MVKSPCSNNLPCFSSVQKQLQENLRASDSLEAALQRYPGSSLPADGGSAVVLGRDVAVGGDGAVGVLELRVLHPRVVGVLLVGVSLVGVLLVGGVSLVRLLAVTRPTRSTAKNVI